MADSGMRQDLENEKLNYLIKSGTMRVCPVCKLPSNKLVRQCPGCGTRLCI